MDPDMLINNTKKDLKRKKKIPKILEGLATRDLYQITHKIVDTQVLLPFRDILSLIPTLLEYFTGELKKHCQTRTSDARVNTL